MKQFWKNFGIRLAIGVGVSLVCSIIYVLATGSSGFVVIF